MKITLFTIRVTNLEESLKFYQEILGMKVVNEIKPNENLHIVFLQGEGEVQLELIEDKTITILDRIGSIVSIGIYVESIETMAAFLREKKVPLKRGPLTMPNGTKLLFISDPNGVEIEFIQDKARD